MTLAVKPKSKSDSDFINTDIDPQSMFKLLTTVANGLFENTTDVFQYELSSVPSSIFDCNRLPREACKSNLADAIWACGSDCIHEKDGEGYQYVLDGGSLLQRLPWTHGDSFGDITQMYVYQAGEEALTFLYGGLPLGGLNILRWRKFTSRVITGNTSVQVKSLPPTSDSGKFHSLRVYHQCQKWMSEEVDMDPT
ncbi:Hypothetical predicted protein [Mytilus galloprovincialis]|uniref:Uncharacterized protein n=1 Tax=Mytilus galloprovincialis TaxID=29158 RepID=A0A8B6HS42_MYTGA|nr:Hypothetical predicted protein [Mytilus galloprovincialis]